MAPQRLLAGCVALVALTTFLHCSQQKSSAKNKACAATQALQAAGLRGTSMPPKTLAFTFDDGPGARTKELSTYLKNQGIQAAFFVNGRQFGPDAGDIMNALVADGHLVANHTETHRSLTGVSTATTRLTDPEVIQEINDTDAKIDSFVPSRRFLFRPPYGDFDDQTFATLVPTPMNKYVGPILWDIGDKMDEQEQRAADWECWQDGNDAKRIPMKTCGDLYINEINHVGRGIVLMHDPYINELDPEQLGTVDMVMYMVPILKQQGFTFMRVDKVPEIATLLPPLPSEEVDGGQGLVVTPPGPPGPPGPPPGQPGQPKNPCP